MTQEQQTLQSLRGDRGLAQHELGIQQGYASQIETGKRLPGSDALNKIVAALVAADPTHPVTPVEVMAACRESQRQAKRAARVVARSADGSLVGRVARRSCQQPTAGGVR